MAGTTITRYASAAQTSSIDCQRTVFVWLFALSVGWERFSIIQLFGFILVVSGGLIFNEIIVIPITVMSKNVKSKITVNQPVVYVECELTETN